MLESHDKEFNKDFIASQKSMESLKEDAKGYGFTYATLSQTIRVIKEAISKNNLGFIQHVQVTDTGNNLITTLLHINGVQRDFVYPIVASSIKNTSEGQQFGGSVTYAKRYALQAIFGIAADDDDPDSKKNQASKTPQAIYKKQSGPKSPPPSGSSTYADGMKVKHNPENANTGASTVKPPSSTPPVDYSLYKMQNGSYKGKTVSEIDDTEFLKSLIEHEKTPAKLKSICMERLGERLQDETINAQ